MTNLEEFRRLLDTLPVQYDEIRTLAVRYLIIRTANPDEPSDVVVKFTREGRFRSFSVE